MLHQKESKIVLETKSRLKTKQIIPTLTRQDGTNAKTAQEKADTLNEFFVSVFTREDKENIPIPTNRLIGDSLETIQITPDLVCKKLKRLSPEKLVMTIGIRISLEKLLMSFAFLCHSYSTNR